MGLSHKDRKQLLADTKQAAAAFLEDMAHLRSIVKSNSPDPGLIRLSSNVLRRLLVNRELDHIAAPRIKKYHLLAPDNDSHISGKSNRNVVLYQSGSPLLFPMLQNFRIEFEKNTTDAGTMEISTPWNVTPLASRNTKNVRLDGFLSQLVICFRNEWACRREVIKYAAICASGVHTEAPTRHVDKMLARARFAARFGEKDGHPAVQLDFGVIGNPLHPAPDVTDFVYDRHRIDLVLIELLAAAYYLCQSPELDTLETTIREELGVS